jgi:asparagine synthase (glutamine-hydrolysing)
MCGIAGIVSKRNEQESVSKMLLAMNHRGPDDNGIFLDDNLTLGHNRLSIIDLTSAGHQPMTSQDKKITISFNGEIYNYEDLKELLPASIQLLSNTDTEVILELWKYFGIDLLPKLRGMFAIAIWDHDKKQLVLARDHMGIKPLYYCKKENILVFASELKGMIASGYVSKEFNSNSICQYLLNGYVLQPDSIFKDIQMLPPASYLILDESEINIGSYWDITNSSTIQSEDELNAIQNIKSLVIDSVKEQFISDKPIGVFLSGGLDSTIIVSALKQYVTKDINTFSIVFDDDEYSEESDAKESAMFFETNHFQLKVESNQILDCIDEYVRDLDQPSIDGLNTWLVSKLTSSHVTVALSGLGADEVFSGYSIDMSILKNHKLSSLGKFLYATKSLWKLCPLYISKRLEEYSKWRSMPAMFQNWGKIFSIDETKELLPFESNISNDFEKYILTKKFSLLQRINFMHLRSFMMCRLLRDSDAVSMSHSLEVRFPFIDYRIINYLFHLPDSWKIKVSNKWFRINKSGDKNSYSSSVKHLLFQAFKKDLPHNFGKRKKQGFKLPIEKWMQTHFAEDIEKTLLHDFTFFNKKGIELILKNWKNGNSNWTKVWSIYIFEKWVKINLK